MSKSNKASRISFGLSALILVITIISIATNSWAVLKSKETDGKVATFGIWTSCKHSRNDTKEVCESTADGNFIVYKPDNQAVIDIDYGMTVKDKCIVDRNVTSTVTNVTVLTPTPICVMENLYQRVELERVRVFMILSAVVSFAICAIIFAGHLMNEKNQFIPAIFSILVALWMMIGLASFMTTFGDGYYTLVVFEYDWSFTLAWFGAVLSLANTLYLLYSAFTDSE